MDKELGYKIKRMRELRGVRQDAVAKALGIKQGYYSEMEAGKHEISEERLDIIAEAMGVSSEAIKSFDEKRIVNYFSENSGNGNAPGAYQPVFYTFEDIEKLVELAVAPWREHIASLKEEIQVYRRLLKQKQE
jgi:transcriptional regulator with XRE-family HTH domain